MDDGPHILVVDDDSRLRGLLQKYLGDRGYRVSQADSADRARELLVGMEFDLIVLDVMMPGEDGMAFATSMRQTGNDVPILMLTALGEAEDRIAGLTAGVDDYLPKPFEPEELLLRITAILRRARSRAPSAVLAFGPYTFDRGSNRLSRDGQPVHLTAGEANLLQILTSRPGMTISRHALGGTDGDPSGRAVDVQMTRLRRKLENDPKQPIFLQTIRGEGYVLWAEPVDG